MIDIHTHILPGVDDGSPDIETSVNAVRIAKEAGISEIVLTPHYLRGSYDNRRPKLLAILTELEKAVADADIEMKFHIGTEVMLDTNILNDIGKHDLHLADTKYVLVESSMNGFPGFFIHALYDLVRTGYKPILAHPERYMDIQNNIGMAEDLLYRNVYMQINAGSLIGGYGNNVERTAWALIENGFAHFLASDSHCRGETNSMQGAVEQINERYDEYTSELLTRINPGKMLRGEEIDHFYLSVAEVTDDDKRHPVRKMLDFLWKR